MLRSKDITTGDVTQVLELIEDQVLPHVETDEISQDRRIDERRAAIWLALSEGFNLHGSPSEVAQVIDENFRQLKIHGEASDPD